ncbi:MAG: FtsX-like permease family protein [Desulfatiglans sp.]|jgi:putative ABC transport system permease protein|nr:FtsX-like permease family protein [Desulfatiglans sp.]
MLKNYFITALNNLIKNKLYSVINIAGLAIGLAACIIIALYVRDQYSYDRQWEDSDRIYRVTTQLKIPGKKASRDADAPLQTMPLLEIFYKDNIEQSARTFSGELSIDTGTSRFNDKLVLVDSSFPNMFQFKVIAGSLDDTLTGKNNIALKEETAIRYFGNQDPVGKVITIVVGDLRTDYLVTAVYSTSGNTVLDIPLLSLLDDTLLPAGAYGWFNFNTGTYFKVKKGVDIESLKPLMPSFIDKNIDISGILSDQTLKASDILSMDFQKLADAHLDSPWDIERTGGNRQAVISFTIISFLVLLIGCINFIILTTAKSTQRAREIAMRKMVGAKRKQLIVQFLGESTFIVLLSMILAIGIVEIMLPLFESIIDRPLTLNYTSPSTFVPILILFVVTGINGGLYPAFILSGFRPGDTLKANQSKETSGSITLRTALVIFQFAISIMLIISTCVIFAQRQYSINRNPGYDKDNLLVINRIDSNDNIQDKIASFKQELLKLPDISSVSSSNVQPGQKHETNQVFIRKGKPETNYVIADESIDYDFFKTYKIPVIAGRDYSIERDSPEPEWNIDTSTYGTNITNESIERNIIINESAARQLGFSRAEEAIGVVLYSSTLKNINHTVIGVVADNHIYSINTLPRAEVYLLHPESVSGITIRFKGSHKSILPQIKSVGKKVLGEVQISTVFVDQLIAHEFQQEKTEQKILISFSLLAIVIACMGLFGSASFTVERRTKEIGLRKVMGARVKNIVSLLLWQFSKPVLIANIIAWPIAIFAMQSWLERFAYRFNPLLMIPICLGSGFIALVIAWFTVAGNTTRVARSKPIKALRYE